MSRTAEEGQQAYAQMVDFAEKLRNDGVLEAVESLTSLNDAARVSNIKGDTRVVDGPFAEAKEMIGGFFLLNVETREEAVAIAAACPAAQWCTIEVRKIGPCYF
nr:YciI family protein [Caballeronia sp. BR00000012568055]